MKKTKTKKRSVSIPKKSFFDLLKKAVTKKPA